MTLVARRIGSSTVVLWGHVRPGAGTRQVDLSFRDAAEQVPQPLSTVSTDTNGYFTTVVSDIPGREYRATTTLGDGRVLQGPFIHSYIFPVD
jgi:hypothetical protein